MAAGVKSFCMNRRHLLAGAAGASLSVTAFGDTPKKAIFELCYFRMRNAYINQMQRTSEFLENGMAPALRRAGAGPLGFFSGVIAAESPFILALISYPSFSAIESIAEKMAVDTSYIKARGEYDNAAGLSYQRVENSLLRAFDSIPGIEGVDPNERRTPRIFELRTYESNNGATLQRKIRMFDEGEIAIFRRCGLAPIFFGETVIGQNLPNLTYMVAFDDLATREQAWRAFGADPEWQKLRVQPGFTDADIVSNVSNAILRPLAFSDIR